MISPEVLKMRILIVDDAFDNRLLLEAILEGEGFEKIDMAESANEAIDILSSRSESGDSIDLILMDIMMPEITGIEATRLIKQCEVHNDIPIIVVTAKSETNDLVEAFQAGASDYITKPINELELLSRIGSMLRLKSEIDRRKAKELELSTLTSKLEDSNIKLREILDNLREDLNAAGKMQRSLLPPIDRKIPGITFKSYYEPCETIGGDLLNIMQIGEDHCAFYLMDVSGHGIQAAMLAVTVHRMMSAWGGENNILRSPDGTIREPSKVVEELNREFMIQNNNFQYFTMTYGVIDLKTKMLTYTRAGHTPLIIQDREGQIKVLEEGDPPVGFAEKYPFKDFTVQLKSEFRLILFSDGITEARKEDASDFFGDKRFFSLVEDSRCFRIEESVPAIAQSFFDWMEDFKPADDITLLAIEIE